MEQPKYKFCMKQFKPAILGILVMTVVVVGWTLYEERFNKPAMPVGPCGPGIASPRCRGGQPGGAMRAATAPAIQANQKATHPNWGACTNCHEIIPTGSPAPGAARVATAPPVQANQKAPHPNWGSCTNCHDIIGAAATPAAAIVGAATAAPPLGIWIRPLTPAIVDKLGLDNLDGVMVSGISDPSPGMAAGLQVGDVITRIDNSKVENVIDAQAIISEKVAQDSLKLTILRNGRERNLFVHVRASAAPAPGMLAAQPFGVPQGQLAQFAASTRIAIAATGESLGAQVAPGFGQAPGFILFDQTTRQFSYLPNSGAGSQAAGQQAAAQLKNAQVGALIVGNIGPVSLATLRNSGVQVYSGAFGSVQQVINSFLQGRLTPAAATRIPGPTQAANATIANVTGKIAVASTGPDLNSPVAADLALAPYLIIYDATTGAVEVVAKNVEVEQGNGAVQTAQLIVDKGATAVIAGNLSPESVKTLSSLGVFCFAGVSGQVTQAIQLYQSGSLQAATVAKGMAAAGQPGQQGLAL